LSGPERLPRPLFRSREGNLVEKGPSGYNAANFPAAPAPL